MRRLLRWRILLPAVAVSFLVLSMTQASERGASRPAEPTVPPGASDEQALRLQSALEAERTFLAAPAELESAHRVLVSFTHGVTSQDSLQLLRQAAGDLRVAALHYSILDAAGTRHTIALSVREGVDPEVTARQSLPTVINDIQEIAKDRLEEGPSGSGGSKGPEAEKDRCLGVEDDEGCAALIAQSNVSAEQVELNGLTVILSGKSLRYLLGHKEELGILATEAVGESVLVSPIIVGGQ